jgi:AraC-like DNA-binding protein
MNGTSTLLTPPSTGSEDVVQGNIQAELCSEGRSTGAPDLLNCGGSCLDAWFDSIRRRIKSSLAERAIECLRQNPTAFVSVGQWANTCGVTREHLTRCVSPAIRPHALLRATRVAVAMETLAHQYKLNAMLALKSMGYSSLSHGFTVFKSVTGITPSQWWRRLRRKKARPGQCMCRRCPLLGATLAGR